jgi:hypothetical protein
VECDKTKCQKALNIMAAFMATLCRMGFIAEDFHRPAVINREMEKVRCLVPRLRTTQPRLYMCLLCRRGCSTLSPLSPPTCPAGMRAVGAAHATWLRSLAAAAPPAPLVNRHLLQVDDFGKVTDAFIFACSIPLDAVTAAFHTLLKARNLKVRIVCCPCASVTCCVLLVACVRRAHGARSLRRC